MARMALPENPHTEARDCCTLGSGPLTATEAESYARLFKVLADPTRLRILSRLTEKGCAPMTVNDLTVMSGLAQPTVSHHLKLLSDVGLVKKVRAGRAITHQICPEPFAQLRTGLQMG